MSYTSPPPTAAQFVEVAVDVETGQMDVERMLMVVDCGRVINPITAAGQVEGGMAQALGFALSEEMLYDAGGQPLNSRLGAYYVPRATDMPPTDVIFVQTNEPSGPFGAKSVAEIAIDGVAPALASAFTTPPASGSARCPTLRSGCGKHCSESHSPGKSKR